MNPAPSAAPSAAIFGMSGLALTDSERAFFRRVRPVGYILFARNVRDPAQVKALVAELRALVPADDPSIPRPGEVWINDDHRQGSAANKDC